MENAIKAFEEGNHNAFKDEEDLSVAGDLLCTDRLAMNNKIDRSSNYNKKSSFSDGQKALVRSETCKWTHERSHERTENAMCFCAHAPDWFARRALNVGSTKKISCSARKTLVKIRRRARI